MAYVRPLGALFRGIASGVAGAAVQNLFFKATAKVMPETPKDAFDPPEPEQKSEYPTHTVARRAVELFAQRGPLTKDQKQLGSEIVHYSMGGVWGGIYGLTMESFPSWKGAIGTAAFSTCVWMFNDNFLLPYFQLAAWPQAYPAKNHLYAWVAHLAYGAGLWLTYTSLSAGTTFAGLAYYGARYGRRYGRFVPKPIAKAVVKPAARFIARKPVRDFVSAMI